MFENLKETVKFDYKESYDVTDKIEEELVQIEENSHKYASEKFMEALDKVKDEKEPMNISSVGEKEKTDYKKRKLVIEVPEKLFTLPKGPAFALTITHTDAMMQPNMIRYEKNSHALLHAAACPSPVLVYAL